MGGYGSGYPWWRSKKTTVEECRQLSTTDLLRAGVLRPGLRWVGGWRWWNAHTGETTSTIGCEVDAIDQARPWVCLFYTFTRTGEAVDYKVAPQTTCLHFGGLRWWFTCPLVVNGQPCRRRVRELYLPPAGTYFGCRHCYDLTYRSCQESDKRVSALRRRLGGNMLALLDAANRGEVDLLLTLKATRRLWR